MADPDLQLTAFAGQTSGERLLPAGTYYISIRTFHWGRGHTRLSITPPATATTGTSRYPLKVEVVAAPTGGTDTILAVGNDSNNYYRFFVSGAQLFFQAKISGGLSQTSIAFDPVNHRFWRFRLNPVGDQVVFETSPNGVNWNDRRTVPRQIALTAARIELSGGTSHSVAAPGKSIFDNFVLTCN